MEVPYVVFEVQGKGKKTGTYAIDVYFVEFVALKPRKAVFIKGLGSISLSENAEKPLPRLLQVPLGEFLMNLYSGLLHESRETRRERVNHMRRWNIARIFGIPTGHSRHIAVDERLAKVERENTLGLALLEKVLGVKDDLESVEIREVKLLYRRLWLENSEVVDEKGADKVYTNLLKIDPVFRTAFYSALLRETALTEEIRVKAQAFS
jgi:hypothetical protein